MRVVPLLLLASTTSLGVARAEVIAFTGAHLVTVAGDEIDGGVLVIEGGKIVAVGSAAQVKPPEGATVRDCSGMVIMPGLVDTHSHIGDVSGGDSAAALQPSVRALDAIDVRDHSVSRARAGGITTAHVMPGSGLLMSGQTVVLKLRQGGTIDDLLLRREDGSPISNMKMANGTNPRGEPPLPGTRAKAAALVREQFVKAQSYRDKLQRFATDPAKLPERDLGLEALVEVLDGRRIVHHHTHRADDILTVLRLQQEFGFQVVLHHVSEAWKVADAIAAAKAPCSIILVDSPGGKLETADIEWKNGAVLEQKGVLVAFHTDDPITDSRRFLRMAALGVRAGMTRAGALAALTRAGAKILGIDGRTGTLEPGKDADFLLLTGDPLSVYTKVQETWVEGAKVFDRAVPADLAFAVGGEGAGDREAFHGCCFADEEDGDR